MQTKIHSALESIANIATGYLLAVLAQMVILPLFDIHASTSQHLKIAAIFTVVSLIRSYCLRRLFNRLT